MLSPPPGFFARRRLALELDMVRIGERKSHEAMLYRLSDTLVHCLGQSIPFSRKVYDQVAGPCHHLFVAVAHASEAARCGDICNHLKMFKLFNSDHSHIPTRYAMGLHAVAKPTLGKS